MGNTTHSASGNKPAFPAFEAFSDHRCMSHPLGTLNTEAGGQFARAHHPIWCHPRCALSRVGRRAGPSRSPTRGPGGRRRGRVGAGRHPGPGRRQPGDARGARPLAHLLRARPRPHPARQALPPARRQVPGVRRSRDDHQRTRLTHALEVAQVAVSIARPVRPQRGAHRGHRHRPRLRPRPGRPRQPRTRSRRSSTGGYDHAVCGADVVLAPLNLCAETLDGIRNHSWNRPAPATPEGEVVAWADRIAYVCHDFEDAVAAGIVSRRDLPAEVARRACGPIAARSSTAFITAMVDTIADTGPRRHATGRGRGARRLPRRSTTSASTCGPGRRAGRRGDRAAAGRWSSTTPTSPTSSGRRSRASSAGSPEAVRGRRHATWAA